MLLIAVVAGGAFLLTRDDGPLVLEAGEVFLEPANDPGPDAFTTTLDVGDAPEFDIAAVRAAVSVAITASGSATTSTTRQLAGGATTTTDAVTGIATAIGDNPGLYGGTQDASRCDRGQLAAFLIENAEKAAAWVDGVVADASFRWSRGRDLAVSDVEAFIAELTPITLLSDTRVTNNGFSAGKPSPRQAVLQAGTSVLVDVFGVPRAKCNCGNPLASPVAQTTSTSYTGSRWDEFDPAATIVVDPATEPIDIIEIIDIFTGELIERPTGTGGDEDIATGEFVSEPLVTSGAVAASTSTTGVPSTTSTDAPGTTVTVTEPPTTTEPPVLERLSTRDYCEAFTEYSAIDAGFEDSGSERPTNPEYLAFLGGAYRDMANISPPTVQSDWQLISDEFERDPDGFFTAFFEEDGRGVAAAERIFADLETNCDFDLFGEE
ncbi:MAG: DUF6777 domain-containing protein [Acidimicrobiia bacterium]